MSYKPCDAAHLLSKKAKLKEEKGETIVRPNPEMSGFSFFLLCFSESHVGSTVSAEVEFHIKNIGVYEVSQDRCPGVSLHLSFACHRFLVARFLFPPPRFVSLGLAERDEVGTALWRHVCIVVV